MTSSTNTSLASWLLPAAVLSLGSFAMGTDSFVVAGILPGVAHGLHTRTGDAGQVVTVFALAYAIAAPILATVTSHLPRKALMLTALTVFASANVASAVAPTLLALLATRMVAGVAAAAFTPTGSAAAASLAGPSQRGRAISLILGGLTVGTVLGVPLGTWIGQSYGWRASLLYVAWVAAAADIGLLVVLPRLPQPQPVPGRTRIAALKRPAVLAAIVVMLLGTAGSIMVYTFIADVLRVTVHLEQQQLSALLVLWGLGGTVGAFGSGWLTDRIGARRAMIGALSLLAATLVALPVAHSVPAAAVLLVLNGCAGWAMSTPSNHHLTRLLPLLPAVAISYNSSAI